MKKSGGNEKDFDSGKNKYYKREASSKVIITLANNLTRDSDKSDSRQHTQG